MKPSQTSSPEMPLFRVSLPSGGKQRGGRYPKTLVLALGLLALLASVYFTSCGRTSASGNVANSAANNTPAGNTDAGKANVADKDSKPDKPEPPKEEATSVKLADIHKDYEGDKKGAKERWEKKLIRFEALSFVLTDVESGGKPWLSAGGARCVLARREEAEIKMLKACQEETIGITIEGRVKEMERDFKLRQNVLVVTDCKTIAPTPDDAAKMIREKLAGGDARRAVTAQAWVGKFQRAGILKDGDTLTAALAKEVEEQVIKTTHIEISKLLADFKADSHAAHNNYENIELQLRGRVKDLETDRPGFKGLAFFKLTDDAGNSVDCQSTKTADIEAAAKAGSIVTIRGNCRGVLTDERGKPIGSWLDYCEVVKEK